jgi:16S rRNA (guanine(527)-N(7))-methyltransferase RsmG
VIGDAGVEAPQIARFLDELATWGARINLVGSLERPALEMHVRDSLAAARALPPGARVVDLGTGAGFPGIPIAIARADLDLVLVEIRERRVHFLRHVVRTLGLRCEIRRASIEEAPPRLFDRALLRAVAPLPVALAIGRRWIEATGEVWVWTREPAASLDLPDVTELALDPDGERGRVLRIRGHAFPRGTP